MEKLRSNVLTYGSIVMDEVIYEKTLKKIFKYGGPGLNFSTILSFLGVSVSLDSIIGSSKKDKMCLDYLKGNDIDTSRVIIRKGETPEATFFFDGKNVSPQFHPNLYTELRREEEKNLAKFSFLSICDEGPNRIPFILKTGSILPTSFSPGPAIFFYTKNELKQVLETTDYIIVNKNESDYLLKNVSLDELFQKRCKAYIETLDKSGSKILTQSSSSILPSYKINESNPSIGCGDAFHAGFVYGLLNGENIIESAKIGNKMAYFALSLYFW